MESSDSTSKRISASRTLPLLRQLIALFPITYIVIDALDECDQDTRLDLLDMFLELLDDPIHLVKIFVSSRDDQDISDTLGAFPSILVSPARNGGDVAHFIRQQTQALIVKRRLLRFSRDKELLKEAIINKLTESADGMFLWVTLQLEVLCRLKLDEDVRDRLGRLPTKLADLYQEIYERFLLTD
ncbi:hypothetical protein MPER_15283, partial [Moniliophthora perniciosa FA553]